MSGSPLSLLRSLLRSSLLRSSLLCSLLLCASLGGTASAVELIYQGPPGSSGLTGATPGAAGTAGGAGSAAIGNIFSTDLSNLLGITGGAGGAGGNGANGNPGQPAGAAGAGGAGGLGSATLGAAALASGPVASLWVQGVGGAGGAAGQSGDDPLAGGDAAGGAGGHGVARGTLASNSATVTAQAVASGGAGGSAVLGRAGNGGNASASLAITLASTLNATVAATATGGSGGDAFGNPFELPQWGIPGAGGNAASTVTVTGAAPAGGWNAVLDITSTALGGAPGQGFLALDGGAANASASAVAYGRTASSAVARGSFGAEAGGSAVAQASVVSSYSAVASASAEGGGALYNAGAPATAYAQASGGYHASADAVAQSGSGRFGLAAPAAAEAVAGVHRLAGAPLPPPAALVSEARAHALASAQGSTVRAASSYRDDQLGAAVGAVAASTAQAGEFRPEAYSAANLGGAAYGAPIFSDANPAQVIAYASALPTAASVATLLAAAPVVTAAFADSQVLGAGTVGAMFYPFASSATYQLPFTSGSHLLLGLLNPFQDNAPFAAFTFTVSNGGVGLYSGSFNTPAQYATFFDDQVLDLGAIDSNTLDLLLTFTLTEGIYGFNYVLGAGAALTPVPEPSTWLIFMLGLALLAWRAPVRWRVAGPG